MFFLLLLILIPFLIIVLRIFYRINSTVLFIRFEICSIKFKIVEIPIILDSVRVVFFLVVLRIRTAVFIFSQNYIFLEVNFFRFHFLVLLFVGSILLLIFSPRLIRVLLGWDGLGLTSFLLVIFYNRKKSINSGLLTAFSNRVGDCFLLLAIASIILYSSWRLFLIKRGAWADFRILVFILLVFTAITKRAQFPFSAWLPAAIAAPTPVSSLVHSSTLVTAGVYLIFRFSEQLNLRIRNYFLLPVGLATLFLARISAVFEIDIKKIVALSTLRQLGLIIRTLGLGLLKLGFVLLVVHAFFKALLFISVGRIIHTIDEYQDLRKTGIYKRSSSSTALFRKLANFSLIGLPFFRGFYSKDLVIESIMGLNYPFSMYFLFYSSIIFTAIYSTRFIVLRLVGVNSSSKMVLIIIEDRNLLTAMYILFPLAICRGSVLIWIFVPSPAINVLPTIFKFLTLGIIILGVVLGFIWRKVFEKFILKNVYWSWGIIWGLPYSSTEVSARGSFMVREFNRNFDFSFLKESFTFVLDYVSYKNLFFSSQSLLNKTFIFSSIIIFSLILLIL